MIFKKVSQCQKTGRGTLRDFSTSILSYISEKIERVTLWENFFLKKSLVMPKKTERGDPLVSSGFVCYEENLFGSVPWANGYNLPVFLKLCRTFGVQLLFLSLQVYRKKNILKTLTKSHDNSRLFFLEKRRLKTG